MVYFFDIEKAKKESGLDKNTLKKIEEEASKTFPHDEMMAELHILRAIESLLHPLPSPRKDTLADA